jgi:hypothetical protein
MRKLSVDEQTKVSGGLSGWSDDEPMDEVTVTGRRPRKKDPFQGFPELHGYDDIGTSAIQYYGGGGGGGGAPLEEGVVQASKCPIPDMFAPVDKLGLGERGDAWKKCFEVMTTAELMALKKVMDQINKAVWKAKIAPAHGYTQVMVNEIGKALAGDRSAAGHAFGEAMQSAMKSLPMTELNKLRAIFR